MDEETLFERRRTPRQPVQFDVLLAREDQPVRVCGVLDANVYGCRLEVGDEPVPDFFHLIDPAAGLASKAEVRWRQGTMVGVRFIGGWTLARPEAPDWLRAVAESYRAAQSVRAA